MPAVAIKISEELAHAARVEADHTDRSLTGQVEHWAKLGRVAETQMTVPVVNALKRCGGDLGAIEDESIRRAAMEAIERLHSQTHFSNVSADLLKAGGPRYEADPANPQGIIQVSPDGKRTRGKMVARKFIAAE